MLSKMMNKRKNDQDERYIQEDVDNSERKWKNREEEEVSKLKNRYKPVRANMKFWKIITFNRLFLNCYMGRKYFLILLHLLKFPFLKTIFLKFS